MWLPTQWGAQTRVSVSKKNVQNPVIVLSENPVTGFVRQNKKKGKKDRHVGVEQS